MKTIRKIMAAIDLSEYSRDILTYAGVLAKSIKSELIIVNVINNRDIEVLQKAAMKTDAFSVKEWLRRQKEERLGLIEGLMEETDCNHLPNRNADPYPLPVSLTHRHPMSEHLAVAQATHWPTDLRDSLSGNDHVPD